MAPNREVIILKPHFVPSFEKYAQKIQLHAMEDAVEDARTVFNAAAERLKPAAAYCRVFIDSMKDVGGIWEVSAEGRVFRGKALKALSGVHRVFPYIATCGTGMENFDFSGLDMLAPYWVEEVKLQALSCAREAFIKEIRKKYRLKKPMSLNPGSGNTDIWPIEELNQLFQLLDGGSAIGVHLTESSLMIPNKTVAGLLFTSPLIDFESCEYCEREHCPDRRVPYRETL